MMSALTKDNRFEVQYYNEHREERANMCEVLDKIVKDQAISTAEKMLDDGISIEKIIKYVPLSFAEVSEIAKKRNVVQPV